MAERARFGARMNAELGHRVSGDGGTPGMSVPVLEVAVVSGVRLYADGLSSALDLDPEMSVCATLTDGRALARLLDERDPDVVVLDLPGLDDLEDLRALVTLASPTPFVALAHGARPSGG
jgi:DNA-binding NarL/FixJ family response regulator